MRTALMGQAAFGASSLEALLKNDEQIAVVYTPPDVRGRGHATACVGALCRLLIGSGWGYCALFADLENAAANRVYRKVGFEPICEYDEYVFW